MNREITQENLYLLLPGKINSLAKILVKEKDFSFFDAINMIYKSNTYKLLETEKSKYWTFGPVALYECIIGEILK